MKIKISIITLFSLFSISILPCLAEKAYVTDSFRISFRRGPSIENKILKFIESGQPVEIIDSKDGWSRIQLLEEEPIGLEGWVLSRYLISRQPWAKQTERLSMENGSIKEKLSSQKITIKELSSENKQLKKQVKEDQINFSKLEEDYETLKQDSSEYLKLKEKFERNQKKLEMHIKEIRALKSSSDKKWFAMGALVVLFGIIIGLQIGKQSRRGRNTSFL